MPTTTTYLFGAGASADAGVPIAASMVRRIYDHAKQLGRNTEPLDVVIGGLRQRRATFFREPFSEIDVEELYEALTTLGSRSASVVAPFVASWSPAVLTADSLDVSLAARRIGSALRGSLEAAKDGSSDWLNLWEFENELANTLHFQTHPTTSAFWTAASDVLTALHKLCWVQDPSRVSYFEPFLRSGPKWIATLNYDNTVELAAQQIGLSVDWGIQPDGSVRLAPDGPMSDVCLAKLHGSVDWGFESSGKLQRTATDAFTPPALVFGSGNKLRVDGPYLDLLFAFRARLLVTDELHICGYSFRDSHINHLLLSWLQQGEERKAVVHDPKLSQSQMLANLVAHVPSGWSHETKLSLFNRLVSID